MSLSHHEPLQAGRALCSPKSNQQRRAFIGFFEVGWSCFFWKSSAKRRLIRRDPALSSALHTSGVIPMAAKDFGFMSQAWWCDRPCDEHKTNLSDWEDLQMSSETGKPTLYERLGGDLEMKPEHTMAFKWTKASRAKLSKSQKARWKERKRLQRRKRPKRHSR
jgi:hypothetical protein